MFPSVVNDSARQMMGRLAEYVKDNGVLTATGTNTIAVTSNAAITAISTGMTLVFRAAATNTTAVTLNLNGLGGKQIRKIVAGGTDSAPLVAGDINISGVYELHYDETTNAGAGAWIIINPTDPIAYYQGNVLGTVSETGGVPTGALMESGANANGRFWRFAGGLQIATSATGIIASVVAGNANSGFLSFPANFSSSPRVTTNVVTQNPLRFSSSAEVSTGSTFRIWLGDAGPGTSVDTQVVWTATGAWF